MSYAVEMEKIISAIYLSSPSYEGRCEREDAFLKLGRFLDENCPEGRPCDLYKVDPNPVWMAVEPRIREVIGRIENGKPKDHQLLLHQFYSSSIIVQSAGLNLGFDMLPMPRFFGWTEGEGLTNAVVAQLDALLITHHHEDHYDRKTIEACIQNGLPIYLPASLAGDWGDGVTGVNDGDQFSIGDVSVTCRSGFHVWRNTMAEVPLIYYEVTMPGGYRFIYGGDVDYTKSIEVTPGAVLDALFVTWRSPNALYEEGGEGAVGTAHDALEKAVCYLRPKRVIYEHYAELDHIYKWFGASYELASQLKKKLSVPSEFLFWGESFSLTD